ncbi:hypothetical protein KXD40_007728 [Peronospora effusa]|uniref:Uncharacterized protein n=1 Tax=Peronospora effusa TaxID=542832 RepID=A0A425BX21_9STRA|nr:hypothetical protein DD237_007505 [Peronospora effusa]UIZ23384.1 hypothetical protein KXD40_007728 [Peronospora effusa]
MTASAPENESDHLGVQRAGSLEIYNQFQLQCTAHVLGVPPCAKDVNGNGARRLEVTLEHITISFAFHYLFNTVRNFK